MKQIIKLIIATATIFTLIFSQVFAAAVPAKFFVSAFEARVGQVIEFELKVDPTSGIPVYTVIANLEYDKNLLAFRGSSYQPGWIAVAPDEVTDTANGVIKRTAGYPAGLSQLQSIVKYTFEAKAPGTANVRIIGSSAYDAENNDLGLQNKTISVKIGAPQAKEEKPVEKEPPKDTKKQQTIDTEIVGSVGFSSNKPYNFIIKHKLAVTQPTMGTTSVKVIDSNGQEVLEQQKSFNSDSSVELPFVIEPNRLQVGDYKLSVNTNYENQKTPTRVVRDLGVVFGDIQEVEKQVMVPYIPFYIWVIIGILSFIMLLLLLYNTSKKFKKFIKNF